MPTTRFRYRWFPPYMNVWLPFSVSIRDIREWNAEIDPPSTILPRPISGNILKVSLHRILIEAGIALTPATSVLDPRSWFSIYRYGWDFAGTAPSLRWYSGASAKDLRLLAVASEEVSTGITCYILREHFTLDHITDAYAVIQSGDLEFVNPTSKERPDYFCLDSSGEVVIAESKGATGSRSKINKRINPKGWDQVQNVRPVNHPLRSSCGRAVIGTHICIQNMHPRSETTTIIKDPDGEGGKERNPNSDNPIRLAYSKVFRFAGNEYLAEGILLRRPTPFFPEPPTVDVNGLRFWIFGNTPFGDLMGIDERIGNIIFLNQDPQISLTQRLPEILIKFREERKKIKENGYAFSNGIVVLLPHNL